MDQGGNVKLQIKKGPTYASLTSASYAAAALELPECTQTEGTNGSRWHILDGYTGKATLFIRARSKTCRKAGQC